MNRYYGDPISQAKMEMTSKEKAIEALDKLLTTETVEKYDLYNVVLKELKNPTLEDAIKVVEKMKNTQNIVDWIPISVRTYNVGINNEQFEDITNYEPIFDNQDLFDDILTALKGLEGE